MDTLPHDQILHAQLDHATDPTERAILAGLLRRINETPREHVMPISPIVVEALLQELVDVFDPDPDPYVALDWCQAVDEVIAACEWSGIDLDQIHEWAILLGVVRAFGEGLSLFASEAGEFLSVSTGHSAVFWREVVRA